MGVSENRGLPYFGVLRISYYLGYYIRVPNFGKLPYGFVRKVLEGFRVWGVSMALRQYVVGRGASGLWSLKTLVLNLRASRIWIYTAEIVMRADL